MESKKDIGTAIKNSLNGFKDSPDEIVWNNLETHLKKKRRAAIYWFSSIGAGVLFLMLFIIVLFNNDQLDKVNIDQKEELQKHININQEVLTSCKEQYLQEKPKKNNLNLVNTKQDNSNNAIPNNNRSKHYENKATKKEQVKTHNVTNNNTRYSVLKTNLKKDNNNNNKPLWKHSVDNHTHTATLTISPNTREDTLVLITKQDIKEKIKDSITDTSRWSITPHVSLSYYGAFKTKTSRNLSFNYGLLASYKITDKTYIRIGLKKLSLNKTIEGLEKTVEYTEFPLQVKYAPFNYRLNPYFTAGLSYYKLKRVLNKNLNTQTVTTFNSEIDLGLHLGVGIEYKLMKKLYFNIESQFNYQLNPRPYNNGIKPFILSINTGLEYKF